MIKLYYSMIDRQILMERKCLILKVSAMLQLAKLREFGQANAWFPESKHI